MSHEDEVIFLLQYGAIKKNIFLKNSEENEHVECHYKLEMLCEVRD
jgi:hypothetical protein